MSKTKRYFLSMLISLSLVATGLLVLAGWAFDIPLLKSVLPGHATMKANIALAFTLIGVVLWLVRDEQAAARHRKAALACSSAVLLIGSLTLVQYIFGWNLGIDELIVSDTAAINPGRMAEATAFSLTLLGSALLLLVSSTRYWLIQSLALIVLGIALLALVGYLYGVDSLYGVFAFSSIALPTAAALLTASLMILFTRPHTGLIAVISANTTGGIAARRLLPAVILVPLLLGLLRLRGQQAGLYGTAFGLALFAVSNVTVFALLVWWIARLLNREDAVRRQTTAALLQSENRFQNVLDNLLEGAEIIGFDWRYLYVNDASATHGRMPKEVLLRSTVLELYPGIENSKLFATLRTCMEERTVQHFDDIFVFPDGSSSWFELSIQPVPEGIFILSLDVTERKQAEMALRESQERFRLLLESAPESIVVVDEQGIIQFVNDRAEGIFGYSIEEMQGQPVEILIPARFADQHTHHRAAYAAAPSARFMGAGRDLAGRRKDGTEFPIEVALSSIKTSSGLIVTAFVADITGRKSVETSLKRYAQRMEILHQIDMGILEAQSQEILIGDTLGRLRQLIPCQRASVGLFDFERSEWVVYAVDAVSSGLLNQGTRLPIQPGSVEQFSGAQSVVIDDLRMQKNLASPYKEFLQAGLVSVFHAHLFADKKPLGALSLFAKTPAYFTPEYQSIAIEVANQLAIAVHQFQLSSELARQKSALETHVVELQRAEDSLRHSEARYRSVIEDQTELICRYDLDLRLTFANRAYASSFGMQPEEIIGSNILDRIPSEAREQAVGYIRSLSRDNPVGSTEHQSLMPDQTIRWFQWTDRALLGDDGSIIEYQGVGRDITDRKLAEEALQEANETLEQHVEERTQELQASKERAEAILNNSLDGILLTHADFRIQQTNDAFNQLFRCEANDYFNQPLLNLLTVNGDVSSVAEAEINILRQVGQHVEVRARRMDGTVFDAELSIGQIRQGGLVCTIRDITERKRSGEALRESEARYRLLAENVSDVIIKTDPAGVITFITPSCIALTGYTPEEFTGRPVFDTVHPEDIPQAQPALEQIQQVTQPYLTTHRIRHKDGHYVWVEATNSVIRDPVTGHVRELISVIRDISERKQAEEILNARIDEELTFQLYLKALHEITIELTQIDELDTFYRRAVELALERMGFERMALFLYDEQDGSAQGTYGTNPEGEVVDERHVHFTPDPEGIMLQAFKRAERFYFDDNVPLSNNRVRVGVGWNAATVLWNGTQSVGWLVADNLLSQSAPSKPLLDILGLYGLTLGTLLIRKRDQTALRESEERFRRLLNAAPLATVISDEAGHIALINSQAEALFGYERNELIGQPVEVLVPEYARDTHIHHRADYLSAPRVRRMGVGLELFAVHKDSSQFPVEIELSFIETNDGLLVMSFVADITERKAIAAALEQQRSFLRNVIDVTPSLIFVKDYNGRFVLANPMLARVYNTTIDTLIGKTDADFHSVQAEVNEFLEADRQVISSGVPLHLEESLSSPLGEIRWFQTTKVPVAGGDGKSKYVLGVSTDITERKQAEEKLRQAFEKERELGELKSRFVSMASHEFRTPLATILALTDTLSAYRHKLSEEQIEIRFGKIREQVGHLKDIMEDVLQLARLQARRMEFNPVRLNLDALCRSVIDEFESRPDVKHHLTYSCDEALHDVWLDKKLLRQIINNLVSNAIKYSPPDKTVTIKLEHIEQSFVFRVSDEGIGIPEADLKHLFEPFHRAENVGAIPGTGLGLVITKESVELHGGTIGVESTLGVGTIFTVQIPLTASKENNYGEDTGD